MLPKLNNFIWFCYIAAKVLIEGMNRSVDPCVDFNEYACGNWGKHNPLPEGEMIWNLATKVQKNVENRLKGLLIYFIQLC